MSWFDSLPPDLQTYLLGFSGDTTAGLVVEFVKTLLMEALPRESVSKVQIKSKLSSASCANR